MSRAEAIKRLCAVMGTVNNRLTDWRAAADCVCIDRKPHVVSDADYRNDGVALEFIERAVFESLAKIGGAR